MDPEDVFVYGTLMPGRLRWPLIHAHVAAATPGRVRGRLYDTGLDYPAAVFDPDGDPIDGWTLAVRPQHRGAALALLDRIEGEAYRRVVVTTDEGRSAWSYEWLGELAGLRRIDRWDGV